MQKTVLLFCASLCAFAQFDGLAGSASRTVTLNADEATFGIELTLDPSKTVDEAVGMLKDAGVTAADLVSVSSFAYYPRVVSDDGGSTQLSYEFGIVRPFSEMRNIIAKLDAVRRGLKPDEGHLQFVLSVGASETSVEQMRQKIFPELLAEAKKNAEFLARSSQMTLGAIQTVSDNNTIGAMGLGGGYGGPGSSRSYYIRVTFSVYARWAARAQ